MRHFRGLIGVSLKTLASWITVWRGVGRVGQLARSGRRGRLPGAVLPARAPPGASGTYRLVLEERPHAAEALLVLLEARHAAARAPWSESLTLLSTRALGVPEWGERGERGRGRTGLGQASGKVVPSSRPWPGAVLSFGALAQWWLVHGHFAPRVSQDAALVLFGASLPTIRW